tara:strand:+ start:148 stop:321 length:174 start_codon:yes stop_codon:yes gene_type:complete
LEADLLALKIMKEMGFNFDSDKYKKTLKVMQDEKEIKENLIKNSKWNITKAKNQFLL